MVLIYCYGIINEDSFNLDIKAFEQNSVYFITFKDIQALVSKVSEKNFCQEVIDKNIKDMKWLTEYAQVHEKTINQIMESINILPMKFCTLFKDTKTVQSMLEEKYGNLKYNLNNLKDKVEIGVKVYFDSTPVRQQIIDSDEKIKSLEQEAKGKQPGAAYFVKQKIELLVKDRLERKLYMQRKKLFDELRHSSIDAKKNDLISKKLTGKDMLLNSVFLVHKDKARNFKEKIVDLKIKTRDIEIEAYGPFPPYNFVR